MEDSEETGKRSANWRWGDSFEMVKLVDRHGKNWGKILQCMHDMHRITEISDCQKIRKHYDGFRKKVIKNVFKHTKFTLKNRKEYSEPEIRKLEQDHAIQQGRLEAEYNSAVTMVKAIEDREVISNTENRNTESEIREQIAMRGAERKSKKDEKLAAYLEDAADERRFRASLLHSLDNIADASKKVADVSEMIIGILNSEYLHVPLSAVSAEDVMED
jgi:hypothetical protein